MIKVDMTQMRRRFQPGQVTREPRQLGPTSGVISGNPEISASLAERIIRAHSYASGEPAPTHLELGPVQPRPVAVTSDEIVEAYNRARRQAGEDDDGPDKDKPKDRRDDQPSDRPEERHRGPDQTRIVATSEAIVRAMKLARGER